MPKSTPGKLMYQRQYNDRPEMVKRREENNRARALEIKEGKVHVGDGKDVDHKKPLDDGGGNSPSNLRIVSEHTNRSWRKGQSGYDPGKQKK